MDKDLLARHGESEEEEPDDEEPSKAASTGKEPNSQARPVGLFSIYYYCIKAQGQPVTK